MWSCLSVVLFNVPGGMIHWIFLNIGSDRLRSRVARFPGWWDWLTLLRKPADYRWIFVVFASLFARRKCPALHVYQGFITRTISGCVFIFWERWRAACCSPNWDPSLTSRPAWICRRSCSKVTVKTTTCRGYTVVSILFLWPDSFSLSNPQTIISVTLHQNLLPKWIDQNWKQ